MPDTIPPDGCVGILGGGQLGRMLAVGAAQLGLRCHVYDPASAPCAAQVASGFTQAAFDDEAALRRFAAEVDVVTYEFENIDQTAVALLGTLVPVRPGLKALEVSSDRLAEKQFLNEIGLATAPYRAVNDREGLGEAVAEIGLPAILKTRRLGYDGKGQARLSGPDEIDAAWESVGPGPAVLEGMIAFEREISVIVARGLDGGVAAYDPAENSHREGILIESRVPAAISRARTQEAVLMAGRLVDALDYTGVAGVEMFVTETGLLVNEFAPRVHNSGHWTQDACLIDQFEQHIRAICGLPMGDGRRHSDAVMHNLLGAQIDGAALRSDAAVHIYGKGEARPGRKMGHVTQIVPRGSPG